MTKHALAAMPAAAFVAACAAFAFAAGGAPSQHDIEDALNLRAGFRLPVVVAGLHYEAEYLRIETRRDGEYALIFRIKK